MKNKLLFFALLLIPIFLTAQETAFDFIENEMTFNTGVDVVQLADESYVFSVTQSPTWGSGIKSTKLFRISSTGELLAEHNFSDDNLSLVIHQTLVIGDELLSIAGKFNYSTQKFTLWTIRLNNDLEVIEEHLYPLDVNMNLAIFNAYVEDDLIYCTGSFINNLPVHPCVFVLSTTGELITAKTDFPFLDIVNKIIKIDDHFILRGDRLRLLNEDFEVVAQTDQYPFNIYQQGDLLRFTDSTLLITGRISNLSEKNMVLGVIKNDFTELSSQEFGMGGDTIDSPSLMRSLDFIDKNKIFYGATSNVIVHPNPFQTTPSWIYLSQLDSSLNVTWAKHYGGDAYYLMYGTLATKDGGCLMYGTRHNYNQAPNMLELYIIKIDSEGGITSTTTTPLNTIDWNIYPNPFIDNITLQLADNLPSNYPLKLSIYDKLGRTIIQQSILQPQTNIDVQHLSKGSYIITLTTLDNQLIASKKLVK